MVKKRSKRTVTALPVSHPASPPMVHANDTEIIPDDPPPQAATTAEQPAAEEAGPSSRPVRLYADGEFLSLSQTSIYQQCAHLKLQSASCCIRRPRHRLTWPMRRHFRPIPLWARPSIGTGEEIVSLTYSSPTYCTHLSPLCCSLQAGY